MLDKAEPLAFQANEIWKEMLEEDDPSLIINNNLLGSIYQAKGDYTKAISYLMQAREQWKKTIGSDHPSFTQNAMSLASIYWKKNELKKPVSYIAKHFNYSINKSESSLGLLTSWKRSNS
ncbi:MAG: tetratricopeptide repeat protein [Chitinophagaceae bacterium]|nr:tetratricopeptide repeat protein [Chitinophagaceae bacterium]